ncbi:hypothetical protein D3C77_566360 [compost metagenome]
MLAGLYQFEMILNTSRAPRIYPHEVQSEEPALLGDRESYFNRLELGFERRIERLSASFASLSAMSLSAKAAWKNGVYESLQDLQFLKDEYEEYVRLKLLCVDPCESDDVKLDRCNEMAMKRDVFKRYLGFKDEFGAELESVVKRIEVLLNQNLVK